MNAIALERLEKCRRIRARQVMRIIETTMQESVAREADLHRKLCRAYSLLWDESHVDYIDPDEHPEKWKTAWKVMDKMMLEYEPLVSRLFDAGALPKERLCKCGQSIMIAWRDKCRNCLYGTEELSPAWTDGRFYYYLKQRKDKRYYAVFRQNFSSIESPMSGFVETYDKDKALRYISETAWRSGWKKDLPKGEEGESMKSWKAAEKRVLDGVSLKDLENEKAGRDW
jgi:hypothetical protein